MGKKGALPFTRDCRFSGGENFGKYAVPFATGSCRKFKSEVLVEWKAPKTYKLEDLSRELFLHCGSAIIAVIDPTTVFFFQVWEGSSLLA